LTGGLVAVTTSPSGQACEEGAGHGATDAGTPDTEGQRCGRRTGRELGMRAGAMTVTQAQDLIRGDRTVIYHQIMK